MEHVHGIDVFELAHKVSIVETISQYIKLESRNGKFYGLCPFHNDKRVGSFIVFPDATSGKRGWFQCYACGEKGDNIDFVKNFLGISLREAAITICVNAEMLSRDEADVLLGKAMGTVHVQPKKTVSHEKEVFLADKRDPDHLSRVYSCFAKAAEPLSSKTKNILLQKRRIPASSLAKYFQYPARFNLLKFWGRFRIELSKEFGLPWNSDLKPILLGVPGFFINNDQVISFPVNNNPCVGIKIFDRKGRVSGIQMRALTTLDGEVHSKEEKAARYKFLSSGYANGVSNSLGTMGCSCGYVEDVLYPVVERKEKVVAITEGRFKAEILAVLGYTVVNMHSISNWKPAGEVAIDVAKEIGASRFVLCYDCELNDNVISSAASLYEEISPALPTDFVVWDPAKGKGIDDVIIAGYLRDITRVSADEFFEKKAG